jgi:hypothetical protein
MVLENNEPFIHLDPMVHKLEEHSGRNLSCRPKLKFGGPRTRSEFK